MATDRSGADRGSALLLMPVAILIVFLLGAISVDAAVRFQAQREAVADAQAIAHDAVSAVAPEALRAGRRPTVASLDASTVDRRVAQDVQARGLRGSVRWEVVDGVITVTVTREAVLLFSAVAPGGHRSSTVQGTATAVLVDQDGS